MRKSILALTGLFAAIASQPALADEGDSAITITGSATVVSDYRFRGLSQSNKRVALQAGVTATHESGFYASVWGSSIDDYVNLGDVELDLIGGYSHTFGPATVDVGVLYYYYPNAGLAGFGIPTDFFEPYASVKGTVGPATLKASVAYAPKQAALGVGFAKKQDNLYIAGDLSATIPNTPIGLTAHIGHTFGPSYLVPDPSGEYTDWSVGATYTWKSVTLGVSYVDTDTTYIAGFEGRNQAKAGVVGSIGVAF